MFPHLLDRETRRKFLWIGIWGIAFGFLESIIVIYLRQMYFPDGFTFPLIIIPEGNYSIELIREATTLLMLAAVAILAGRNRLQRIAFFLYAFAMWDIFYYAGLKLFLGWPPSLFTWDILFLIPVAWEGPVLAPLICSLTMVLFAVSVMYFEGHGVTVSFMRTELSLMLTGAILIFIIFVWDYSRLLIRYGFPAGPSPDENSAVVREVLSFVPSYFHWEIFIIGEIAVLLGLYLMIRRLIKSYPG